MYPQDITSCCNRVVHLNLNSSFTNVVVSIITRLKAVVFSPVGHCDQFTDVPLQLQQRQTSKRKGGKD